MRSLRTTLIACSRLREPAAMPGNPPPEETGGDYVSRIQVERADKDQAFRDQANEPVPPDKANEFLPLKYFPPDPDTPYRLAESFNRAHPRRDADLGREDSKASARRGARVHAQRPADDAWRVCRGRCSLNRLFVPFNDMTSGAETTPRAVSRARSHAERLYTIDFNKAFNPYCYYNARSTARIRRAKAVLPIPIRAGERLP